MAQVRTQRKSGRLVVHAIYLRPVDRGPVLATLCELGLFVCEQASVASQAPRDLAVIAVDGSAEHAAAVEALALHGPVVALVPADAPEAPPGALVSVPDDAGPAALRDALVHAARVARGHPGATPSPAADVLVPLRPHRALP